MVKFVAVSCLHAPLTDRSYFEWLLSFLEGTQPDYFINLGDWYEGKPAKRFDAWPDEKWGILTEHKEVARQANAFNEVLPNAKKVWLYGNHDDNTFGIAPDRVKEDVREAIRWQENKDVAPALKDWTVIEEYSHRAKFRLGPVTFQHGCDVAMNSMQKAAYLYGGPYGLYVCGHTHRPLQTTQAEHLGIRLPYWYANPGCGADWDRMHYMKRMSMAKWGRGLIVGEVSKSAVSNRKSTYSSKQWDAELKVHSWAHP